MEALGGVSIGLRPHLHCSDMEVLRLELISYKYILL